MDKEEFMKMAREAGLLFNEDVGPDRAHALKKERIEDFANAIIERAALELDKKSLDISFLMPGSVECAKIIRALKPSNDA